VLEAHLALVDADEKRYSRLLRDVLTFVFLWSDQMSFYEEYIVLAYDIVYWTFFCVILEAASL